MYRWNKNNEMINKYLKRRSIAYYQLSIKFIFNERFAKKIIVYYVFLGKVLNAFMKYQTRIWFDVIKHIIITHCNNNADSHCSAAIKGNLPYSNVPYDANNLLILWGNNITINASKSKVTWFCENNCLFVSVV